VKANPPHNPRTIDWWRSVPKRSLKPLIRPASAAAARDSRRATVLIFGGAAALIIAVHLGLNGMLGFHIDELYYLDSGRHPALGYVDYPPVVPLIARLETSLLGVTPWTLRVLPALLGGVNVLLCGAYARKLGGSLKLQALALAVGIASPAIFGTWLFQTVIFDQVTWMVSLYLFLSLALEPKPRTWILLGLTLGIGLEVKYTIVALIAGIGIAVLLTPALRAQLRTRYPWLAAGLMLVIWLPNIIWQVANAFPSLSYTLTHGATIASGGGPGNFLVIFAVVLFLLLPLWIAGLISLFRHRELRPIGIACAVPFVVFLFVGKGYYPAPALPIVMVQGLLAISRLRRARLRHGLTIAVVAACVLNVVSLGKIVLPITPADRLHATGLDTQNPDFASTVGWPSIANQVTAIYEDLPASERSTTAIISSDYGVAGALAIYENPKRLPDVLSPQQSDWFWLPQHLAARDALMVGYAPSDVSWMCASAAVVAHLTVPYQVVNLEQGTSVTYCHLNAPIPSIWGRLKDFS
jgi:Dolichyl-phosphate-mannose-protein mannosyltransferase